MAKYPLLALPVTPHVGVWIETNIAKQVGDYYYVTPHVGVWIETNKSYLKDDGGNVTPHVGVWIETIQEPIYRSLKKSLPMWECGLKLCA